MKNLTSKSLLRYPGGKTRAVDIITLHFPDIKELCSPFFGGGSIEIFLAEKGIKVYGYDVFTPLVEFWQTLQTSPKQLKNKVQQYFPLNKQTFYQLQEEQHKAKSKIKRATIFYVLNRSSFSGSTLSGGMSPNHPRFNQNSIDRITEFHNPNFSVDQLSFDQSIIKHRKMFKYLDPPYLIKNTLYGKDGNTHKNFNHILLHDILMEQDNWIMSYNDCKEIRDMYKSYQIIVPSWAYGMSTDKKSKEILIFSKDLKPIK